MASASFDTAWEFPLDYTDVDRIELPEIDCALLTALLEESLAEVDGDETENPAAIVASDGLHGDSFEDCGLEDMLLDTSVSTSTSMNVDDSFRWVDMDVVVPSSPSDDMGDWFMGTGEVGMVDYDDSGDYDQLYSYYGGDVTVEDGYSPLWQ